MSSIVDHWFARSRSNPRLGSTKADFVYYTKDHGLSARHARATMKANDATTAARAVQSVAGYEHAAKRHREAAALHRKRGDSSFVAEHVAAAQVYEELAARMRRRERSNPIYAVSLKTGASKRVDQDRKKLLMAIYKRLHQVGDGRIVAGKHVVMHAPSGFKTFVLEDMTHDELKALGAKLAGRRANPKTIGGSDVHHAYLRKQKGYRELDVKAIDNHGRKHPVVVYNSSANIPTLRGKMVLQIVDTPGSWYLATITEKGIPARMSIDMGSGWTWDNVREVVAAI